MTHSDYIWIAIRIFGIYLVIQVVVSLVVLVSIIASLVAMLPFDAFTFTRSNMVVYRSRFIGQVGGLIRPPFS